MIEAYIPGSRFPDISITGGSCQLQCDYCRARYLRLMEHATTPKQLYDTIRSLVKRGARGILISGGFNRDGRLPIEPFLPAIRDAKRDFDIVVSVHAGLVNRELAEKLRSYGIDIVDYELILDPYVIKAIKHLRKEPEDFIRSYEILIKHGPTYIAPHIPIGFNYGKITHEYDSINYLRDHDPYITIFLVFIPTKGTPMENVEPPSINDVVGVLEYARRVLKGEIGLGCMRPWRIKGRLDRIVCERKLVDRIVNPPKSVVKEYGLKIIHSCCSVPRELLDRFMEG